MKIALIVVAFLVILGFIFAALWRAFRANQGKYKRVPVPLEMIGMQYIIRRFIDEIDSWRDKGETNCNLDTRSHQITNSVVGVLGLLSSISVQIPSKGVAIPIWLSILLSCLSLILILVQAFTTESVRKHEYGTRWSRIRGALDGMILDYDMLRTKTGVYSGKEENEVVALAVKRLNAWVLRARGTAPLAPIPE